MFWVSLQVIRSYFKRADPFYDEQENHSLIGVANVFLESLFYDVKLQYAVPIVNQKGEVRHSLCGTRSAVSWEFWDAGSIPGPAQWVEDPVLLQLWLRSRP